MLMISTVVENSEEISGVAGRRDVLEEATTSVIQLMVKRMVYFRHFGSWQYFSDLSWTGEESLRSLSNVDNTEASTERVLGSIVRR